MSMSITHRLAGALLFLVGCGADNRPATWDYLSPVVIQPNCASVSCHSRAAAVAGLDFSDPTRGYTSLTQLKVWIVDPHGTTGCRNVNGDTVCQRNFRPMISPYNPEQSRLVNMLRARGAARMPPDRPLNEADIRLVEQWIRDGAFYRASRPDAASPRDVNRPPITTTVNGPDGSTSAIGPSGADAGSVGEVAAPPPTPTMPSTPPTPGTPPTPMMPTTRFPSATPPAQGITTTVVNPDGTTTVIGADGTTMIIGADGMPIRRDASAPDGATQDAAGAKS